MSNDYRYQLDKSSNKHLCPGCGQKRFVRYVDLKTNDYLPTEFGRCDREISCQYFASPYESREYRRSSLDYSPPPKPEAIFIPKEWFKRSQTGYRFNHFVTFLTTLFDRKTVTDLIQSYHLGTSKSVQGGCIFYQVDLQGNIRRGKIIVYNARTGRRGRIDSVHNQLNINRSHYPEWRFLGEHLLYQTDKPVAIVESEKTAIIASVYLPEFLWLATGTISTLKPEYARSLKGRHVTLFPDIGAYSKWREAMEEFQSLCNISISDLLERKAGLQAKQRGYDLADYLIPHSLLGFMMYLVFFLF
jgi:hypothetical protein